MEERWHRHLGVYGIGVRDGKILLILKNRGPYTNRHDLPGGSAEPDETLASALHREFREEAGVEIRIVRCLGVQDYVVPHRLAERGTTHLYHVTVFYEVECLGGGLARVTVSDSNDAAGAEWVEPDALHPDNCSPLVMQALDWVKGKADWRVEAARLVDWTIRQ